MRHWPPVTPILISPVIRTQHVGVRLSQACFFCFLALPRCHWRSSAALLVLHQGRSNPVCAINLAGNTCNHFVAANVQVCCGKEGCCPSKRCINNATTNFEPNCCGDDCNVGKALKCCPGGQICVNVTGTSGVSSCCPTPPSGIQVWVFCVLRGCVSADAAICWIPQCMTHWLVSSRGFCWWRWCWLVDGGDAAHVETCSLVKPACTVLTEPCALLLRAACSPNPAVRQARCVETPSRSPAATQTRSAAATATAATPGRQQTRRSPARPTTSRARLRTTCGAAYQRRSTATARAARHSTARPRSNASSTRRGLRSAATSYSCASLQRTASRSVAARRAKSAHETRRRLANRSPGAALLGSPCAPKTASSRSAVLLAGVRRPVLRRIVFSRSIWCAGIWYTGLVLSI
jgi:hypothetical protein